MNYKEWLVKQAMEKAAAYTYPGFFASIEDADSDIVPILRRFNELGYTTYASCSGTERDHPPGSLGIPYQKSNPRGYIAFEGLTREQAKKVFDVARTLGMEVVHSRGEDLGLADEVERMKEKDLKGDAYGVGAAYKKLQDAIEWRKHMFGNSLRRLPTDDSGYFERLTEGIQALEKEYNRRKEEEKALIHHPYLRKKIDHLKKGLVGDFYIWNKQKDDASIISNWNKFLDMLN